ncbi:diguanylate cyclase [Aliivibrio sp.]|uniref:sensor domain-containing diguanylate cyclase n=1 Tax=Aliivibrio sp. TaxID=1872443 RepID=UPI003D2F377F
MTNIILEVSELHWAMQVTDHMDAGLVVLDRDYNICAWNSFMVAYSGVKSDDMIGKNIFEVCEDLPKEWLTRKVDATRTLKTRSFTSWEDRPYLFNFANFCPVSGSLPQMYQNITLTPLTSLSGEVTHVSMIITDVTDIAKNKLHLRESNKALSRLSQIDGLTGLFNRAYWENKFKREFTDCKNSGLNSTVVMLDIDHFKKVNDTYGHIVGDDVIRETAALLLRTSRGSDFCGRYGGDEFAVLLPKTTQVEALYFADRLRKRVEETIINTDGSEVTFTISIGVSQLNDSCKDHLHWLGQADRALYQSKQNGRNRTTVFEHEMAVS